VLTGDEENEDAMRKLSNSEDATPLSFFNKFWELQVDIQLLLEKNPLFKIEYC
jgi:hypothetical protein